jgi:hypothetical protein
LMIPKPQIGGLFPMNKVLLGRQLLIHNSKRSNKWQVLTQPV